MGYSVYKMGSLYIDNIAQTVGNGGIIYNGAKFRIGDTDKMMSSATLTWIKPAGMNLLVSNKVLLTDITWQTLAVAEGYTNYATGHAIEIDGVPYMCRMPRLEDEWGEILDIVGDESDDLWHWNGRDFWGQEDQVSDNIMMRRICGGSSARFPHLTTPYSHGPNLGFRPLLEPCRIGLNKRFGKVIELEGQLFRCGQGFSENNNFFFPVLLPTRNGVNWGGECLDLNVFKNRRVSSYRVDMYTLLMDGEPVRQDLEQIPYYKAKAKIELTDRYFGPEYLIPWTIQNGVARAKYAVLRGISHKELLQQGFCQ